MRLSFSLQGDNFQRQTSVSVRRLISSVVLLLCLFLVSSRATQLPGDDLQRVQMVKQGLLSQQKMLSQIAQEAQLQDRVTHQQLAKLLVKLKQVEARQQRIADTADITLDLDNPYPISDFTLSTTTDAAIAQFDKTLQNQIQALEVLELILSNAHINAEQFLSGLPVQKGWLSSYYGMRDDPFTGRPAMHKGLDFAGKEGTPVVATGAGVVTWAGERFGYGNLVEINHGNNIVTRYGHNAELNVIVGEVVTKGQTIASLGNTGRSTGAHVHYEVIKNGKQIDPLPFVYR